MPSSFADLGVPTDLVSTLRARGVENPFAIQTLTLADGCSGRDLSGRAPTGSGKTLAFGIPLVARIGRAAPKQPARSRARADPRARRPGVRRARLAGARAEAARRGGVRRRGVRTAAQSAAQRRRRRGGVPGTSHRPAGAGGSAPRRGRGRRRRRGRPHGRHGLPSRGPATARPHARDAPDAALLGDPRRCSRYPDSPVPARPGTARAPRRPRAALAGVPPVLAGRARGTGAVVCRRREARRAHDRLLQDQARDGPAHQEARAHRGPRPGASTAIARKVNGNERSRRSRTAASTR